mmetsp:Transcript_34751/g.78486  ORF Transcript_34751/g.78486 Transcript_34751/m.78486 type:complete len:230 (+) Transcript_34751:1583-2272(+)
MEPATPSLTRCPISSRRSPRPSLARRPSLSTSPSGPTSTPPGTPRSRVETGSKQLFSYCCVNEAGLAQRILRVSPARCLLLLLEHVGLQHLPTHGGNGVGSCLSVLLEALEPGTPLAVQRVGRRHPCSHQGSMTAENKMAGRGLRGCALGSDLVAHHGRYSQSFRRTADLVPCRRRHHSSHVRCDLSVAVRRVPSDVPSRHGVADAGVCGVVAFSELDATIRVEQCSQM